MWGKSMTGKEIMRRNAHQTRVDNRMLKQASNLAIVYLEGDTDKRFYIWATDRKLVFLQSMSGKDEVLKAIRTDNKQNLKGRLAIIDSDFDYIIGKLPYDDKNLVVTDTHDIETMMFEACGNQVIEDEYIDINKLGMELENGKSLWTYVINFAIQLGKLRLMSLENNWKLNFQESERRMGDYFHIYNGYPEFKFYGYMKCIWKNSVACSLSYEQLKEAYDGDNRIFDQWHICRGHDLSLMLAIVYSTGMYGSTRVKTADIESTLRTSYRGSRKFKKSNMYKEIKTWQRQNNGCRILCDELC